MTNRQPENHNSETILPPSPLLDTSSSAVFLKATFGVPCEAKTLAKLRCVGGGPKFRRFGRLIRYDRQELELWARNRLSQPLRSTSDAIQTIRPTGRHHRTPLIGGRNG